MPSKNWNPSTAKTAVVDMAQIINFNIDPDDKPTIRIKGKNYWDALKFAEFNSLDLMVQTIVLHAASMAYAMFGRQTIVTSMYRPTGSHSTLRMVDTDVDEKCAYGGWYPAHARYIVDEINSIYAYDPNRPQFNVAVYALAGDKARRFGPHLNHIHWQCHRNTKWIGRSP